MTNNNETNSPNKSALLSRAEVEHELRARAHKDTTFRKALRDNPRETLERDYPHWFPDGKIPKDFSIKIIEEEEQTLNLVLLSPRSVSASLDLSEEDLANIQGGSIVSGLGEVVRRGGMDSNRLCMTDVTCSVTGCTHVVCRTSSCSTDHCR